MNKFYGVKLGDTIFEIFFIVVIVFLAVNLTSFPNIIQGFAKLHLELNTVVKAHQIINIIKNDLRPNF